MNYLKKIQRKVFILGMILVLSGLFFSIVGIFLFFEHDQAPTELSSLKASEVSAGDFVSLKELAYIGTYATQTEGSTDYDFVLVGTKDSQDKVYFLTLRIKSEDNDALYQYVSTHPDESWTTSQFFHGNLISLPQGAKQYLDAALQEDPIDEHYEVKAIVLEGKPGIYVPNDTENQIVGAIFVLLGLIVLAYIAYQLIGKGKKQALKVAASLTTNGDGVTYMENFDLSAEKFGDSYANEEAILSNMNFSIKLIPFKDILWAYTLDLPASVTGSIELNPKDKNFMKFYKARILYLRTVDKKRYMLALRSLEEVIAFIDRIKRANPDLSTIAFDPQLEKAFKKDPLGFKAKADYVQARLNPSQPKQPE